MAPPDDAGATGATLCHWAGPLPPEARAAGEPDEFWVKNYLENGLRLPKMQKIYIKMFGSNATFFKILSFTADNTKSFALKQQFFKFCLSQLTVTV